MRVQAYGAYQFALTITVATPRSEPAPSTRFFSASIHEDYCAQVAALLREFKQCGESAEQWPAAKRIQNYFPQHAGKPIYALRAIRPLGAPRDIDPDWQLEVMRIRYEGLLVLLPGALLGNEIDCEAMSRNVQAAVKALFVAQGVPDVFIPGQDETRPGDRTEIDIICEMGAATDRRLFDVPTPA